jgi:hypothetical protein
MKFSSFPVVALAGGLLAFAPAFAQTSPNGVPAKPTTVTKQPTDGGDSPSNPRATDATAAEWRKQHIDGGDSPDNPRALQKQQAQSYSHPDNAAQEVTKHQ